MRNNLERLPEKYYQRRRIAAGLVLLVVVALLVWALTVWARSGSPNAENNPQEPASGMASVAPHTPRAAKPTEQDTEADTQEKDQEAAEKAEDDKVAAPAEKKECQLSDLIISASSDKPSYGAGEKPAFYMAVKNPTDTPCSVNLDEQSLRFEVYDLASNRRIWSDVDCHPSEGSGTETFEPGVDRYFEAVWSRMSSAPDQCHDREPVPPGSYFLHTVIGDNPSEAYPFNLN